MNHQALRRGGWRWGWICACVWTLTACGPSSRIRIGFLGGLSDRASSVSQDARNGVMQGIEQRNASGGIAGRPMKGFGMRSVSTGSATQTRTAYFTVVRNGRFEQLP